MQSTHEAQTEVIEALQDYDKYSGGINLREINGVAKQMQPFLKAHRGDDIRLTTAVAFALGTRHGVKKERARRKESDFIFKVGNRQAKIELSDEISELGQKINRAQLLIGDVTDRYFNEYDSSKKEDVWKILYEFNRYREFSGMVLDYIAESSKLIDGLTDISSKDESDSKTA